MLDYINKLSFAARTLHEMANKHLKQLAGSCDTPDEEQDYYLGILRRQAMLAYDLGLILHDRPEENLTTPYIILRSMLDDYLHLTYLDLHENPHEEIIKINAEGHRQNFNSLMNLTVSENQEYYGENLGYLSDEELEQLKDSFRNKEENHKYFIDIENFKFQKFRTLTDLADSINGSENCNVARDRALFLWKSFSSFVHYSTYCFNFELGSDIIKWQQMEESLQYVYNSIFLAFKFFNQRDGVEFVDSKFIKEEMEFAIIIN